MAIGVFSKNNRRYTIMHRVEWNMGTQSDTVGHVCRLVSEGGGKIETSGYVSFRQILRGDDPPAGAVKATLEMTEGRLPDAFSDALAARMASESL